MSADVQTQIFTTWLPLAMMVVFGLLGLVRGVLREAVLASTVALAAFVNSQWARQWGEGLHEFYNPWPQQQEQFWLSLVVLWAITLVVGYGLGSMLPRRRLNWQSRILGLLLGLITGAALAGWSLRYYVTNTDGTLADDPLLHDIVSRAAIIWATWFPLMLVFLAAIVVLVGPLRRMQGRVASPAEETDWRPSEPPRPAVGQAPGAQASGAVQRGPVSAAPYAPPAIPPSGPVTSSALVPPTAPQAPTQSYSTLSAEPGRGPGVDWSGPSADRLATAPHDEQVETSRTRAFSPIEEPPTSRLPVSEEVPSQPAAGESTGPQSTFTGPDSTESSWLLAHAEEKPSEVPPPLESRPASSEPTSSDLKEGDSAQQVVSGDAAATPVAELRNAQSEPEAPAPKRCPNCGHEAPAGASFCTQCGTRL